VGELEEHSLGSVVTKRVAWKGIHIRMQKIIFFYGKGNVNHHSGIGFFVHKKIISVTKGVESVSKRMSYITLKDRWCDIIVKNVHAPTECRGDDKKDRFLRRTSSVGTI
jgi:hypothetical protein